MTEAFRYDEIGYWSEIKLDIIKDYAAAYSLILSRQKNPELYHLYIDAFAGAGKHRSRSTGKFVPGSPCNALHVDPPFREYHFIDLNKRKVKSLQALAGARQDVYVHQGDCNKILLDEIFPRASYNDFRRALCLLDPYGLHLDWEVIRTAGQMRSLEIFLNFPVADINRNVLWRRAEGVAPSQMERMSRFWGDDSWQKDAYAPPVQQYLFENGRKEKVSNEAIAESFRARLKVVAGFAHVPKPIPMRNRRNTVVYYLFFASQKPVAEHIVQHIFDKYAARMGS
jgi:three-Cys-motif partner protein